MPVETFIPSLHVPPGRVAWYHPPVASEAAQVIVFLDGELYLDRAGGVEVLAELEQSGDIPPVWFISNHGPAARHEDFACSAAYARFLAEELPLWIAREHPGAARSSLLLVGLSLSGLAAAYAALSFPGVFRAAICQSPSCWWNDESLRKQFGQSAAMPVRLWLSVGDAETTSGMSHAPSGMRQETSQLASCQRTAAALTQAGHDVAFRIFPGGHDPACWHHDLRDALRWAADRVLER